MTTDEQPVGGAPPVRLAPGLRRVLAPNPSPMTLRGTNTYIVGTGAVAVIDPGPEDERHLAAILAALDPGERVSHILVTHAHRDHSPLARRLAAVTGAPVLAFGDAGAGRSATMRRLAAKGLLGGGEGVDHGFRPDRCLADGEVVADDGWQMEALWTPGHFGNHMCFAWQDTVFTGDLVMGWASSLVSPPDGDLGAFMASLERLKTRGAGIFHSGHGDPITAPGERLNWLIAHRREREAQIRAALAKAAADAASLARAIYTETPAALMPAAERNVLAHLIDLTERNLTACAGELTAQSRFRLR
ncbi:MAG: MBL fold metallo-hydrolase [Paracoccaceae bacterium]